MEQSKELLNLFTSRVRLKILTIFLPHPDEMFYVRQVTRMTKEEVNAVRRELERLKDIGLLRTEHRGNRLYYQVRKDFPFYYDFLRLIGKTTGLGKTILSKGDQLGKIHFAVLAIGYVLGRPSASSEIDVVIVGKINLEVMQLLIREHEQMTGREINYTVMTEDEFEFRKSRGDAFVKSILAQPQVVLIGDEIALNA